MAAHRSAATDLSRNHVATTKPNHRVSGFRKSLALKFGHQMTGLPRYLRGNWANRSKTWQTCLDNTLRYFFKALFFIRNLSSTPAPPHKRLRAMTRHVCHVFIVKAFVLVLVVATCSTERFRNASQTDIERDQVRAFRIGTVREAIRTVYWGNGVQFDGGIGVFAAQNGFYGAEMSLSGHRWGAGAPAHCPPSIRPAPACSQSPICSPAVRCKLSVIRYLAASPVASHSLV